ncbi:hypothetical protein WICPIJ_003015 [Wickerhamomyces pijperi]|uniref:Protein PET20, mitochondrial n=1 Tax=Wickerhamomyces pijperi TaxID=599730 RepID=A0A9P8TPA1_WICPI|nr:hypothetical protein WICPIJ_003015 [Wickerhamomyces pijperi]
MFTTKLALLNLTNKSPFKRTVARSARLHSTSSSDPSLSLNTEANDQNGNATQAATTTTTATTKSTKTPQTESNIQFKKSIRVNPALLNSNMLQFQASQIKPSFKLKPKKPFDHILLPSVPTTKYIDKGLMKKDMFFTGFKPLLTPIQHSVNYNVQPRKKKETIPLTWNFSACKLQSFEDYSNVPQFIVDNLVPFSPPGPPGNEIIIDNLKLAKLKEENERKLHSAEVYEFLKHFRK